MNHSLDDDVDFVWSVVICFQFVFLQGWITANSQTCMAYIMLWFAFNLYFCRDESQLEVITALVGAGCDLLSICIFAGMNHSPAFLPCVWTIVVICFQFVFLQGWITARGDYRPCRGWLWFAFNLYFCRDESQPTSISPSSLTVVICFQFVFLQGWITAVVFKHLLHLRLWFAFNLYFCRDESQQKS